MKCTCSEWADNIDKVNAPMQLQAIRSGTSGYVGVYFKFCPWCGKALEQRKEKEASHE